MSEFDRNISPGIASSSLDFASLGKLRGQAQQQDNKAIKEAARQFESMFAQMMLKSMREASFKSDLVESNAMDTYQGMYDKELASQMSKRGTLGIADMLVRNFEQQRSQPSAADVLASRDAQRGKTGDAGLPMSRPQAEAMPLNSNRGKATGIALPRPNQDGIALPGNDGLSLAPERARND
jgi:flagellar protein FlgJ